MDARFAESWVNRDDHVVLGRRLHPYCLYDIFFLHIDENPIVTGERPTTEADLKQAVLICSTPPEVFLAGRPPLGKLRRFLWNLRPYNKTKATARFHNYINDYFAKPLFWEGEDADSSLKAPWILSIACFLEEHSNMTEREIMCAPIGKMLWKSAAIAEYLGLSKGDLLSEFDEVALKEMGVEL